MTLRRKFMSSNGGRGGFGAGRRLSEGVEGVMGVRT